MSVAESIKDLLEGQSSLALEFGANLFIGREPTSPKSCVIIFDTPGGTPANTMIKGTCYFYGSFQVVIRNSSYQTGFSLAFEIMDYLNGLAHEEDSSRVIELIQCKQEPFVLEWNEDNQIKIVTNYDIQYR